MKEIKSNEAALAYAFDLENAGDRFINRIMNGLKPRSENKTPDTLSKDDFFIAAGIASNEIHAFHVRRKDKKATILINAGPSPENIEKARAFFDAFFAAARSLNEKDSNNPSSDTVREIIRKAAVKAQGSSIKKTPTPNENLTYRIDLRDKKAEAVYAVLKGLNPRGKAGDSETLSKDDFARAGEFIANSEEVYSLKKVPDGNYAVLTINVDPPHGNIKRAEIFFDTFFSESYKIKETVTGNPDYGKVRRMIERVAVKAKEKFENLEKNEIAAEVAKEISGKTMKTEADIFRFTYTGASEKMLGVVKYSQKTNDWIINTFGLKEPEHSVIKQEANKKTLSAKERKDKERQDDASEGKELFSLIHATILDADIEERKLRYSCTELNNDRMSAFLKCLDEEVSKPEFNRMEWIKVFEKAYADSIKLVEFKRSTPSHKSDIRSNKKGRDNGEYLEFDWTAAIKSDTAERNNYKNHFKEGRDGFHLVLYPTSPYADAVYKSLQKKTQLLKYIVGDGNNGNFAVKEDSKGNPSIRLSSKLPFSEERMQIFHSWMKKIITDIPDVLSLENVETDMKSLFRGINEKIELREQEQKKTVEAAKVQEEKKQNHTVKIDKDIALVFLDKLKTNLDKLKKEMHLEAISISGYEVSIGSRSSFDLGDRQKEIKEFIEWMPKQTDEKIVAAIDKGNFKEPLAQFKREKEAEAVKAREASYKEVMIPETQFPIKMLDEEQVEANRYFHEKDLILLLGEAGTGKTFLSMAVACYMLLSDKFPIEQIIIARPEETVGGREQGFLPGGVDEKLAPYMDGYKDNLNQIFKGREKLLEILLEGEKDEPSNGGLSKPQVKKPDDKNKFAKKGPRIVIQNLAYIRGRTLPNTIVVVDECQNMRKSELAVIPRRLGINSKLILAGDITDSQTDLPPEDKDTFKNFALRLAYMQNAGDIIPSSHQDNALDMVGIIQLTTVRRSPFVDNIIAIDKAMEAKAEFRENSKINVFAEKFIKPVKIQVRDNKPKPA